MRKWAALVLFLAAAVPAGAQAPPTFAAVSIKEFVFRKGVRMSPLRFEPTRMSAAPVTLSMLVGIAYGIENFQVEGGAGWVHSEFFAVNAVTDKPATSAQMRSMLREVLAARFGVQLEKIARTVPVFDLMIAPGGPKLRTLAENETMPTDKVAPAGQVPALAADSVAGLMSILNTYGYEHALHRHVVDKTGLTGRYDIFLYLPPDPNPAARGGPDWGALQTALPRELGLEFRPSSGSLDFYRIKSAHWPTVN